MEVRDVLLILGMVASALGTVWFTSRRFTQVEGAAERVRELETVTNKLSTRLDLLEQSHVLHRDHITEKLAEISAELREIRSELRELRNKP